MRRSSSCSEVLPLRSTSAYSKTQPTPVASGPRMLGAVRRLPVLTVEEPEVKPERPMGRRKNLRRTADALRKYVEARPRTSGA